MNDKEFLTAAAHTVTMQLSELPFGAGISVVPELADFMGAFEETALTLDDLADDGQLTTNAQGEVIYG